MTNPAAEVGQHADIITIVVFAPDNASHEFPVQATEHVNKLARTAVDYFVSIRQMQPAECGLAIIRDGVAVPLNDASRLDEDGVGNGAKLKLIVKKPKTDGTGVAP
jgi:hypothetical protein